MSTCSSQYELLLLVWFSNSERFQIYVVTRSSSSCPFLFFFALLSIILPPILNVMGIVSLLSSFTMKLHVISAYYTINHYDIIIYRPPVFLLLSFMLFPHIHPQYIIPPSLCAGFQIGAHYSPFLSPSVQPQSRTTPLDSQTPRKLTRVSNFLSDLQTSESPTPVSIVVLW